MNNMISYAAIYFYKEVIELHTVELNSVAEVKNNLKENKTLQNETVFTQSEPSFLLALLEDREEWDNKKHETIINCFKIENNLQFLYICKKIPIKKNKCIAALDPHTGN